MPQNWHQLVENLSGHRLRILVTDIVLSPALITGISAQPPILPHKMGDTSGQGSGNHGAPVEFWDEFSCTSAYLTNLTRPPPFKATHRLNCSLAVVTQSHLREIGCRAFALI